MKKFFFLLLVLPSLTFGQMKEIKYDAQAGNGVKIDAPGHKLSAVVFLPENYDSRQVWPTILFFHGKGEASVTMQYSALLGNGLLKNIKAGLSIPFVVIAIQDQYSTPKPVVVDYVLKTFLKEYKIDTTRIYATGLSFGGAGSLAMAIAHPEYISAVVSASPSALQPAEVSALSTIAKNNIPVWFWNGTQDQGALNYCKQYSQAIINAGGQAWISTEPVGHGPWDALYTGKSKLDEKDMYAFFSQYGKVVEPPVVVPPSDTLQAPGRKLIAILKVYDNGDVEKEQ
mgnify:CR=1 FL=1